MSFKIKFWGVRGGVAVSSPDYVGYGGNTSCVEVMLDGRHLVFDAGTGIRLLGQKFLKEGIFEITLFLSHTQWDFINGFPFFVPAYDPRRKLRVFAGHLKWEGGLKETLAKQMDSPMFPVPLETMRAELNFKDFRAGDTIEVYPDLNVRTVALNHPHGGTGYRIDFEGKSLCYLPGTEHQPGEANDALVAFMKDADLVIYDATYTEEEFPEKRGWGHSTWREGIRLCKAANAKRLALFHHEPSHDDAVIRKIEVKAKHEWLNVFAAREGMEVVLG
jgi:phosphoribosyl 1,2-cyclic phosphodiesterase